MKGVISVLVLALGLVGHTYAAGDANEGKAKAAVCAACHGADGNSAVPNFPKLAGQGERYLIKQIKDIKAGARPIVEMTGLTDALSDQDIANIAAFYAKQPIAVGAADPELVESGEKLYRAGNEAKGIPACSGCHAPTGIGNELAGFPRLSGQHAAYIEGQLIKFRNGERANDGESRMMRDIAANMSDKEIKALASYISGLF